ncbi:MAG: hypothetical protein HON48_14215 [Desulfobacula sp.]|jgi:hypothetical protein|nr:hypothetical protein [Desulfobacula sp.]
MAGLINVDLGSVIKAGGNILDDMFTSDEERMSINLQEKEIDAKLQAGQMDINKVEAEHKSIFVAGWRPFIGWVGGFALGYKFLFHPLLIWIWCLCQAKNWIPSDVDQPPTINATELYPIIMGMLGLGAMRTAEGIKKVKTNAINTPAIPAMKKKFKWPWKKK